MVARDFHNDHIVKEGKTKAITEYFWKLVKNYPKDSIRILRLLAHYSSSLDVMNCCENELPLCPSEERRKTTAHGVNYFIVVGVKTRRKNEPYNRALTLHP